MRNQGVAIPHAAVKNSLPSIKPTFRTQGHDGSANVFSVSINAAAIALE